MTSKADEELRHMDHAATRLRTAIEYACSMEAFPDDVDCAAIRWLYAWMAGERLRIAAEKEREHE
jgi:hypothetical protein